MKQLGLLFIFWASMLSICKSQINPDSVIFEQQRERVNTLLEKRSQRFGDFDNSLQKKTGIFGIFKRKKDMQKSIDILREIVLTDNEIFLETKKLLNIKDNESHRNENLAEAYDKQVSGYMHTITKLQTENEKLRTLIRKQEATQGNSYILPLILTVVIIVLCFICFRRFRK